MSFEDLLDQACKSARLPEMARILLPSTLSEETKKLVLKLEPEEFGAILKVAYVLFLLWLTILSRQPRMGVRVFKWKLLWAYRAWIAGESFGKTESI